MQRHRCQGLGPREGSPPVRRRPQRLTRPVQVDPRVLPAEEPVVAVASQLSSPVVRRGLRGFLQLQGTSPPGLAIVRGSRDGTIGTAAHMRGRVDPGSAPGLSRLSVRHRHRRFRRDHRRRVLGGQMRKQRHVSDLPVHCILMNRRCPHHVPRRPERTRSLLVNPHSLDDRCCTRRILDQRTLGSGLKNALVRTW